MQVVMTDNELAFKVGLVGYVIYMFDLKYKWHLFLWNVFLSQFCCLFRPEIGSFKLHNIPPTDGYLEEGICVLCSDWL